MSTEMPRDRGHGVAAEWNDLLAGEFDQTNGVVPGLDGESDGTLEGENLPAAYRTGPMSSARLWHPSHIAAETARDDEEPVEAHPRRRFHLRR